MRKILLFSTILSTITCLTAQDIPFEAYKAKVREQRSDKASFLKKDKMKIKRRSSPRKMTLWTQYYYARFKDRMGVTPLRGQYNYEFLGAHYKVKPWLHLGGFFTLSQSYSKKTSPYTSTFGVRQEIAARARLYEVGFNPYLGWQATKHFYIDATFGVYYGNNKVQRNLADANAGGENPTPPETTTIATPKSHRLSGGLFVTYTRPFKKVYIQGQFGYNHSTIKRYGYQIRGTFTDPAESVGRKTFVIGTLSGIARFGYLSSIHMNPYIEVGANTYTNKVEYLQETLTESPRKRNPWGYMIGAGIRFSSKKGLSSGIYARQYQGHTRLKSNIFAVDLNVSL